MRRAKRARRFRSTRDVVVTGAISERKGDSRVDVAMLSCMFAMWWEHTPRICDFFGNFLDLCFQNKNSPQHALIPTIHPATSLTHTHTRYQIPGTPAYILLKHNTVFLRLQVTQDDRFQTTVWSFLDPATCCCLNISGFFTCSP